MTMTDDQWSKHVMNGEAFLGQALQAAIGGQIAYNQIFNPIGSGVRVRLRFLEPIPVFGFAINTNPRRHDVALTTNAPFAGPTNLLGDGPAAVAEIRNDSLIAPVLGSPFWLILSAGNTRKTYPAKAMDWGHDLLPGQGLILPSAVGGFIVTGFMWAEVPLA